MPKQSQPDKQRKNKAPAHAWKPGESGNPNGRPPKGYSITETVKAMLGEKPEIKDALGRKILEMALKGDMTAMKTLWQYMDGMPLQRNELTGKDGRAIEMTAVPYEELLQEAASLGIDTSDYEQLDAGDSNPTIAEKDSAQEGT